MTNETHPSPASAERASTERTNTELILSVLAGTTLLPFVQGMFTKAGEDTLSLIRALLRRRSRRQAKAEIRDAGTVTLADPGPRVVLQMPETISPLMALRLGSVRLPVGHDGWLLVRWDAGHALWLVEEIPEPPDAVIVLD
jgi:hypothetical protein